MASKIALDIDLPYPPSINTYYRRVGHRVLISREGRAFREQVIGILWTQGLRPKLNCGIRLEIEAYPPDSRRRDIDNLLKPLLDALEHAEAFENDYLVNEIRIRRMPKKENGSVTVRIIID